MATEIVMPRLSDTMDSGTIAKWHKQEGDEVKKGDVIAEIETDKANMDLESFANGVLARILVDEGQSVNLGQPIALVAADSAEAERMRGAGETATAAPSATPSESPNGSGGEHAETEESQARAPEASPTAQPPDGSPAARAATPAHPTQGVPGTRYTGGRIKASPLARRMAQEHDIDLAGVQGTGPGGRITKDDVQAFLQSEKPAERPAPAAQQTPVAPERAEAVPAQAGGRAPRPVEMTRMQQTIARRMSESRFSAPEFVLTSEVDMTDARALLRSIGAVEDAPKIGPNDLIIKAVAGALTRHPEANAGWEDGTIVRYGRINIGIAVALPDGLVVPVIQDADKKSLGQIAIEAKGLIQKAQNGKLAPSDYEHGTFSISNLGMYGIDQFTPVINTPEACILGVGAIVPKPVILDGEVVARDRMRLTLSCDHRVIYGAQGAELIRTLRRLLESPVLSVL